jgi:hypothetical protein
MRKRRRIIVVVLSTALYGASIVLPAAAPFNPTFSTTTYSGYDAFELGRRIWFHFEPDDIDCWLVGAAWLANPATWLTIILVALGRWRPAFIAGVFSLSLALIVLPWCYPTVAGLPGYWAWIASPSLLVAAAALELTRNWPRPVGESFA